MPGTGQVLHFAPGVVEKCFDTLNEGPPFETGGPFFLVRVTEPTGIAGSGTIFPYQSLSEAPAGYPLKGQSGDLWQVGYKGSFIHTGLPDLVQIGGKDISSPSDYRTQLNPNDLQSLGNTAYARLRPKVEKAGLGQAIAEARDVPKMLSTTAKGFHFAWKAMGGSQHIPVWNNLKGTVASHVTNVRAAPKSVANHFLNAQFGWAPFVKDVSDMLNLVTDYVHILDNAERRNDRWQQKEFHEDDILSDTLVYNDTKSSNSPIFRTYLAPALGSGTCTRVTLQVRRQKLTRIWYSGSFKYYRPEFDRGTDMNDRVRAARQFLTLAGANISPTLIYKVTPWTWLVDWFTDVGKFVQRTEDLATGSVVARYLYLMRETFDRYEYITTHVYPNTTITATSYQEVRVRRRVPSESPFEFALSPTSLSGMQLGILAALGVSRWL
jgi:hypothetical protein